MRTGFNLLHCTLNSKNVALLILMPLLHLADSSALAGVHENPGEERELSPQEYLIEKYDGFFDRSPRIGIDENGSFYKTSEDFLSFRWRYASFGKWMLIDPLTSLSKTKRILSLARIPLARSKDWGRPLNSLDPSWKTKVFSPSTFFILDEIQDARPSSGEFQHSGAMSLFIQDFPRRGSDAIILDSNPFFAAKWSQALAHEATHLLLKNAGLENWFEEGLARLVEKESSRNFEKNHFGELPLKSKFKVFESGSRSYAFEGDYNVSHLFLSYVKSRYGWHTLKAMAGLGNRARVSSCQNEANFWEEIICRGKLANLMTEMEPDCKKEQSDEKSILFCDLSRGSLFRYFVIAAVLNPPVDYVIPGWTGFNASPAPISDLPNEIQPGEVYRISPESIFQNYGDQFVSSNLYSSLANRPSFVKIYRLLKSPRSYRVFWEKDKLFLPKSSLPGIDSSFSFDEIVIFNESPDKNFQRH